MTGALEVDWCRGRTRVWNVPVGLICNSVWRFNATTTFHVGHQHFLIIFFCLSTPTRSKCPTPPLPSPARKGSPMHPNDDDAISKAKLYLFFCISSSGVGALGSARSLRRRTRPMKLISVGHKENDNIVGFPRVCVCVCSSICVLFAWSGGEPNNETFVDFFSFYLPGVFVGESGPSAILWPAPLFYCRKRRAPI